MTDKILNNLNFVCDNKPVLNPRSVILSALSEKRHLNISNDDLADIICDYLFVLMRNYNIQITAEPKTTLSFTDSKEPLVY